MAARPISPLQRGLYWTLALAIGALLAPGIEVQAIAKGKAKVVKSKPRPAAPEHDPLTEWELVNGAANELREKLAKRPPNAEALRRQMTDLALRSAVGAERALAIGDASLFDSYRTQFREQFHDVRWRIGVRAERGISVAEYAAGVLALYGILEPASVEKACQHFAVALAKGYGGAKFRLSQCLEKDDPARSASLLRQAAASGHPAAAEVAGRACLEARPPDAVCA